MYCNVDDVKAVVDTDMEDEFIKDLIDETDAWIDAAVPAAASAVVKRGISRWKTAYFVALKDPKAQRIGELSMDRGDVLKHYKEAYEVLVAAATDGITYVIGKTDFED